MSPQHAHWRLIVSPPADGPANMAMDEAILESVTAGAEQPTLRLYAWDPACLSIGYAQLLAEADEGQLAERGWSLVRRPTGGRAILHTDELTYAIIAPSTDPHVEGGVLASYRRLSEGLLLGLRRLGLEPRVRDAAPLPLEERADPVCFEVPSAYEITAGGRKLIGSAQLRRQGGVLQHGSLPLSGDIGRICLGLRFPDEAARQSRVERLRSKASTVEELLGRTVAWEEAAGALRDGFAESLGLKFDEGELSRVEADRTDQLVRERYAHPEWTGRV